jgi:hypothetical protein
MQREVKGNREQGTGMAAAARIIVTKSALSLPRESITGQGLSIHAPLFPVP